jgi:molybdopterin-guanine dinucleotide biosynthesis protein A
MAGRAFDALGPWVDVRGVVVAADAPPGRAPGAPEAATRRDSRPGLGPLEGLRVALEWAREEGCEGVVVLACDLPLVDATVVGALVRAWRERGTEAPDGVVPVVAGRAQPLAAVYATSVLEAVTERLARGVRSVTAVLGELRVARIPTGSDGLPTDRFLNVNTPGDARRARDALEARRRGKEGAVEGDG